jgi:hypothetical protein
MFALVMSVMSLKWGLIALAVCVALLCIAVIALARVLTELLHDDEGGPHA